MINDKIDRQIGLVLDDNKWMWGAEIETDEREGEFTILLVHAQMHFKNIKKKLSERNNTSYCPKSIL